MRALVFRTLRPVSQVAAAGVIFAGTALLTGFAALLDTGLSTGPEGDTLRLLPMILGSWTVAIVAFAIVSTVALVINQREREYALMRAAGATPGQVRRLVFGQTLVVALPSIALGVLPGLGIGAIALARLADAGLAPVSDLRLSAITFTAGVAASLLAVVIGALFVARGTAKISPVRALASAREFTTRAVKTRRRSAAILFGIGLASGLTVFAMPDATGQVATAGPACVFSSIGLALLGPSLAASCGRRIAPLLGTVGRLAGHNLGTTGAAAVPALVILVGMATGTLYMQSTDNATQQGSSTDAATIASANYLVVAMVIAFCAIAVVNTLIAATRDRRREFGLLRVVAATPRQVLGMVSAEALLTALLGIVLGTLASLVTIVPYSLVKLHTPTPAGSPWTYAGITGGAIVLAFAATLPGTANSVRAQPIAALAG
ncbi:ABC transporter permease [Amycolatopsis acidicola]|nr:FtsX-like permease family protein [Amycolatopsis acidicola]